MTGSFKRHESTRHTDKPISFELKRQQICDAAARIIHEDGIRDYHKAKLRACEVLHFKPNTTLPTNQEIELAVRRREALFGDNRSQQHHQVKLEIARDLMQILDDYQARLTGSLVDGISLTSMPIEIHAFAVNVQLVCDELQWRGIDCFIIEKRYRFTNNEYLVVPLVICQLDDQEIEISVFEERQLHRPPVCPRNGKVFKRVSLKELN